MGDREREEYIQETNEKFVGIMRRVLFSPSKTLERSVNMFEDLFPGLDLKNLPEYQALTRAISNFAESSVQRYEKVYGMKEE